MAEAEDRAQANLETQGKLAEIIGGEQYDRLSEVLSDDFVDHDPAPDQPAGAAGIGVFWKTFQSGVSDLQLEPVQVIASEDYVTAVLDVSGTHTGDLMGHEATNKSFKVRGIQVARFQDGKMVERWGSTDQAGMFQQLGLS